MLASSKKGSIVGLDFESGSVAATEVRVNGRTEIVAHGVAEIAAGVFREGEVVDPEALAATLKELFSEHKLSRSVRLGIANQRVAVRTLSLPDIKDRDELETAIRFQAQDHIPMPLDQAVLDWQVIGRATSEAGDPRVDVVAVAARRDMLSQMMEALHGAGLRPTGIDHSAFGMIRALGRETGTAVGAGTYVNAPTAATQMAGNGNGGEAEMPAGGHVPARLYCNLGDITNLAVARGRACLFTRIASFGIEGIAQKLAERRELTLEHARQWLSHVGLDQPLELIDGDRDHIAATREALAEGSGRLADEMRLSLDYYGAQDDALAIESVVACGPGAVIPGLAERLQRDVGLPFTIARPGPLAHLDEISAARLTLSYGLALDD